METKERTYETMQAERVIHYGVFQWTLRYADRINKARSHDVPTHTYTSDDSLNEADIQSSRSPAVQLQLVMKCPSGGWQPLLL